MTRQGFSDEAFNSLTSRLTEAFKEELNTDNLATNFDLDRNLIRIRPTGEPLGAEQMQKAFENVKDKLANRNRDASLLIQNAQDFASLDSFTPNLPSALAFQRQTRVHQI